ncbi:MAG: dienelactone hydrolase [Pseudomonadota bacterium]
MRTIYLLLLLMLVSSPTLAVHECGAHHTADDQEKDKTAVHGCAHLQESDFFYGDPRTDAPELAARGDYQVGVRTMHVVNTEQLDILNYSKEKPNPRYDRPLTLEVWYPAKLKPGERQVTTYSDVLGHGANNPERPNLPFTFGGRAARNAQPLEGDNAYPLVIVSHGHSGSRVLMTWLTENLASKGYIVVAIDHTESTHADAERIHSTLIHRPRDINFALDSIAKRGQGLESFLSGIVDAERTAVIGYSMGSYGALSAAGVGVSKGAVNFPGGVPGKHLASLQAGSADYAAMLDKRIKVIVSLAQYAPPGFWSAQGIKNLRVPSLFIIGSQDQTTGYAATQWVFEHAINAARYMLVFQGAIHEIATNPAPPLTYDRFREYVHYQEPAWDNRRLNNVNQHFITAFLGKHLLGETERYDKYLELSPISNDSPRTDTSDPNYWTGFRNWTAIGMEFHHKPAQQD